MSSLSISSKPYIANSILAIGKRCVVGATYCLIAKKTTTPLAVACCALSGIFNTALKTSLLYLQNHNKITAKTSKLTYIIGSNLSNVALIVAGVALGIILPLEAVAILTVGATVKLVEFVYKEYTKKKIAAQQNIIANNALLAQQQALANAAVANQACLTQIQQIIVNSRNSLTNCSNAIQNLRRLQTQLKGRSLNPIIDTTVIEKSIRDMNAIRGASGYEQTYIVIDLIDLFIKSKSSSQNIEIDFSKFQAPIDDMIQRQIDDSQILENHLQNLQQQLVSGSVQLTDIRDYANSVERKLHHHIAHISRASLCLKLLVYITVDP